jgi:hypothetical protein
MLKDKYVLHNRYGDLIQLVKQDKNLYLLDGDLDYMRVGFNNDKTIEFVDPSGGPFMQVGTKLDNFTIETIDSIANVGYLFTLKETEDVLNQH